MRVGCSERIALKQVYYQGWSRSPAQVGCMRKVLRAGALGRPRGMGWGGRWEGGSGWGTHVNPWLIHVNVWQKPLQYCKVISLQLIKIMEKNVQFMKAVTWCIVSSKHVFDAVLLKHPTLAFSHRVKKSVLYICVSFSVLHIDSFVLFFIYLFIIYF